MLSTHRAVTWRPTQFRPTSVILFFVSHGFTPSFLLLGIYKVILSLVLRVRTTHSIKCYAEMRSLVLKILEIYQDTPYFPSFEQNF